MSSPADDIPTYIDLLYPPTPKYWLYCHRPCGCWIEHTAKPKTSTCIGCKTSGHKYVGSFETKEAAFAHSRKLLQIKKTEEMEVAYFKQMHDYLMKNKTPEEKEKERQWELVRKFPDGSFYEKWLNWDPSFFPTVEDLGFNGCYALQRDMQWKANPDEPLLGTTTVEERVLGTKDEKQKIVGSSSEKQKIVGSSSDKQKIVGSPSKKV